MDYWLPIIVLFGAFFFMLALGVPIEPVHRFV